jgi:hypothetical protein
MELGHPQEFIRYLLKTDRNNHKFRNEKNNYLNFMGLLLHSFLE